MAYKDLREYLAALEMRGKLHHVKKEVDPGWEVAAVMRRVFQRVPRDRRPAMMFERIKGHSMPLVAGILGASPEVYALALETTVDKIADKWSEAQNHPLPPVLVKTGPVKDVILKGERADVTKLPLCIWTRGQDPAPEEYDQDKRGGPSQAPPRVATEAHQPRPMVSLARSRTRPLSQQAAPARPRPPAAHARNDICHTTA